VAAKKKKVKHVPKRNVQAKTAKYAAFIGDLLDGTVTAVTVREVQTGPHTDLEYDEE
jgi:hypothetical protein